MKDILECLQNREFYNTKSDLIFFAKGGYRYPRTFKETFKLAKRWLLKK